MYGKDTIDSMVTLHTKHLSISNLYISEKFQKNLMFYIVRRIFFFLDYHDTSAAHFPFKHFVDTPPLYFLDSVIGLITMPSDVI